MLDINRPLHAYDADKIKKGIIVRNSKHGEVFTALDNKTYKTSIVHVLINQVCLELLLSGCVNEFQPSPNVVKIQKSNLAACGETPSFGSALTPISCRHT